VAGGLIGTVVGRTVAAHNARGVPPTTWPLVPVEGPHGGTGLGAVVSF